MVETHVVDVAGLQALIDGLVTEGYTVIGPTVRSGAVVTAPIRGVDDLPRGWGDEQGPATYRLSQRDDGAYFGYVVAAHSPKTVFFPSDELLWRGRRTPDGRRVEVSDGPRDGEPTAPPRYALLGVRSCDLAAVGIHDTVLTGRAWGDVHYAGRRTDAFVVAVACSDPSGSCFCVSMGTGPRPERGRGASFDLSLTELLDGEHRFLVEVGTERGAGLLAAVPSRPPTDADLAAAQRVTDRATERMGRRLDTHGVRELLYGAVDSPHWADVASRCLACTNCTLVCPTCFCTGVEEVTDLAGDAVERRRVWDSCFTTEFSYIHGGSVRESTSSRYRQWITHKLAAWQDQFGTSGCVGCGRCITWCPAAIDITAEVAALRGAPGSNLPPEAAVATPGGN